MDIIFNKTNLFFMLDGLKLTLLIAIVTIILSTIIGVILALIRNYCKGILAPLAKFVTCYVELFRCTPNILWILVIRFFVKGSPVPIAVFACTLFTSAVMTEIIRGGLNSIPNGQFEGAASQGFTFVQTLFYIILPQTFKNIIPALLSQVITIIKDTSFFRVIEVAEFTRNSLGVIGAKCTETYQIMTLFGIVAATYFIICFFLSCMVRGYHKRVTI